MPELPEVETIARSLRGPRPDQPAILGRTIQSVTLRWPRHVAAPSPEAFARDLRGLPIEAVGRRGKYLLLRLDGLWLLLHLRMSGDLRVLPSDAPLEKHDLTLLHLSGGVDLRFHDPRRFGRLWLVSDPAQILGSLGPEPLEEAFTAQDLARRLRGRRRLLKPLLLDQTFLAGLGNIYADEALHRAGLHPLRRSDTLRPEETRALWRGIRAALRAGLRHNGASIDWVYRGGDFQNHFRVYGRAGEPCPACGASIRRIRVGQRSTHYCPHCQPWRGAGPPRAGRSSGRDSKVNFR
ncbi:MAG: bifunctional DNA-formamidopyrimidine glycosylase/DNA-(apurinic or apyrimidinic site) lyase [Anaerolineales bacterium]|jgi:formamidopyrimidine-DNA glycosylase